VIVHYAFSQDPFKQTIKSISHTLPELSKMDFLWFWLAICK